MVTISRLCLCVKPLTDGVVDSPSVPGVPPKEGGPGSLQSSPTGPPPKSAVPAKTGPMVDAPKVAKRQALMLPALVAQGDAIPLTVESRTAESRKECSGWSFYTGKAL